MTEGVRIAIGDQVTGVEFARARLAAELDAGPAAMSAGDMAEARANLGRIDAALVTLRWLARDREGCLQLLTTTFIPKE